MRKKKGIG